MDIQYKRGLTLIELILAAAMFAVLMGVAVYVFRAVFIGWSVGYERVETSGSIGNVLNKMTLDLREASAIGSEQDYNEIRFTLGNKHYVYYLYAPGDSYGPPPAFNQEAYELRKAEINGNIGGSFDYGEGGVIITGVVPPPVTELSVDNGLAAIDITVLNPPATVRVRTNIKPRNL